MALNDFRTSTRVFTDRSSESVTRYFHDVNGMNQISAEEEAELARIIRKGGAEAIAARERLINANLRFVISVANRFKSQTLEFSDLISEGNIGLIKAAENFDETKGFKFISYAVWCIRQAIMDVIAKSSTTLRLPQNQQSVLRAYRQMQEDMLQKEQRNITVAEFCEIGGMDYSKVAHIIESSAKPLNIENRVNEDSNATFGDFIASDCSTDSALDKESLHYDLMDIMKTVLSERERLVVTKMYGIDCAPMKAEEIAQKIGLSHERIRQICLAALKKMRSSSGSRRLIIHLAA